jgi:hypothetical protein
LRFRIAAIFRNILASCFVFLWRRALRAAGAVIEFAFMILNPINAIPSVDHPTKAGLTSHLDDPLAVPAGINMANGRK